MTLQLLISTMHRTEHSLLDRMNLATDAIVVNQCDCDSVEAFEHRGHRVLWIDTTERGLSKSRNMALRNATADICMLADDDMEYRPDYADTVCSAFSRIDSELIRFQVCGIEGSFKDYPQQEQKVSFLRSMKMSSVEIAFRRTAFAEKGICFDELIGAGTEFLMGEENALLCQCLRRGLSIYYVPQVIADLHMGDSTWFNERNEAFFVGKGAAFAAMKTPLTPLLILQFAIRKRRIYQNNLSVAEAICHMRRGKKLYLQKVRELK